ncbi:MAG: threonine--tRNA ligase, partial [Planctomycetaceae bacterium]|nr:threonine--tRNA ligase [Planctomycetaceae bacterium]
MPRITLPDGSERSYDAPTTPAQVAADIGPGLAKSALGATIDGTLCDLGTPIDADCELSLVTPKTRDGEIDEQGLFLLRHSAAHVMAEAITNLFPGVQLVYGPPVEQGFYYDMAMPDGSAISSEDFERIEAEMKRIVKEDRPFTRYEMSLAEGMEKLQAEGSKYKIDN